MWIPGDCHALRKMCECVAGSANSGEESQVRAVFGMLSVARFRHRADLELSTRCAPTRRSGAARSRTSCKQVWEGSSSHILQLGIV